MGQNLEKGQKQKKNLKFFEQNGKNDVLRIRIRITR